MRRSGSFITVLGDNSWRRGTTELKHFGSFHVPESLVPICRIQDGQNRKVKIAPDGRDPKTMILHVSSGHELYIPTEYQDVLRIARYVEFTILDYKPAKHSSLIRLLDVDETYREGGSVLKMHLERERNRKLVARAKSQRIIETGRLECDVCGFSFVKGYGDLGLGYIEAHHRLPLSSPKRKTKIQVKDLALLCSNSHRIIHLTDPMMKVERLKALVKRNRIRA